VHHANATDAGDGTDLLGGGGPCYGPPAMASDPPADLALTALGAEPRTVREWLTTFHLCLVALDPFTNESSWILETAGRLLESYAAADVRVAFLVTGTEDEARQFLGPWTARVLVFADPDRAAVHGLGLVHLPALVHLNTSGAVEDSAEGWDPDEWRRVATNLSRILDWTRPVIPAPGDPTAFAGTPAT
jgi:hypothetical protein